MGIGDWGSVIRDSTLCHSGTLARGNNPAEALGWTRVSARRPTNLTAREWNLSILVRAHVFTPLNP